MLEWLRAATTDEQAVLATEARTSRQYLYHIAGGFRTPSADVAGRIETAAAKLRRVSKGRLPKLTRADICPACEQCPYIKKCRN